MTTASCFAECGKDEEEGDVVQSQDVQVVYGRQVLQRRVPEEHKKICKELTGRRATR